jgi:hypothetical protein
MTFYFNDQIITIIRKLFYLNKAILSIESSEKINFTLKNQ